MIARTLATSLALLAAVAPSPSHAGSEPKLTVLPNQIAVGVEPPVAAPGVARKIVVAGLWPNGCAPVSAELSEASDFGRPTLALLVAEPLTFAPCTAALTSYRIEIAYTPRVAGQVPIFAMTTVAKVSAKGTLVTGSAAEPRSRYDISGAWYDPQAVGSGVTIAHDYGRSDNVFATWEIYDAASGLSRWYSLQQGRWSPDGQTWEGFVFETRADPRPCASLCPAPLSGAAFRGVARLTLSASFVHGGLDAAMDFFPTDGTTQRVANLVRFVPNVFVLQ